MKDLAKDAFEEGKEAAEDFADAVKNQAAEARISFRMLQRNLIRIFRLS